MTSARQRSAGPATPQAPPLHPGWLKPDGRFAVWRRWLGYVVPPLVLLPPALIPSGFDAFGPRSSWAGWLCAGAMVAVVLRLRFPRSAAAAVIALNLVSFLVNGPVGAMLIALVIVIYSVGRHCDRRTTAAVAVSAAVLVGLTGALTLGPEWGAARAFVQVLALVGFAGAAGDGARSRQAFVEATNDRVRRAEESKESEARSRVAEERLKIARDLHDVIAHQIAVINLNASVASQALPSRPDDAERSLVTIREASRTVLADIASLLRVLRASDRSLPPEVSTPGPVPGLAELDRLVSEFRGSGLEVEVRTVGDVITAPQSVDIVAYQVVQEGLTNAFKHGNDSSALLQVEYSDTLLELTVTNTVDRTRRSGRDAQGHGLLGARERVASIAGELETSFGPGPVHRLVARLPLTGLRPASLDEPVESHQAQASRGGAQ